MRQVSLILAAVCVRSKKKNGKTHTQEKKRPSQNTPRNPQQPGDHDHLDTARDETRPTRLPTLARYHRSRICGNRPRTSLAISKNDECYTYTDRHRHRLIKGPRRPYYKKKCYDASRKTAYLPNRTCFGASLIPQIQAYIHPNLMVLPVTRSKARIVVFASRKAIPECWSLRRSCFTERRALPEA